MTKELVEVVQADSCIVMGEGREEDMGQGIGALPTEVGRSAAPDGVEPASPSQAKPAAANAGRAT